MFIASCTFASNNAVNGNGGALVAGGQLKVTNSEFKCMRASFSDEIRRVLPGFFAHFFVDNTASNTSDGGAIYIAGFNSNPSGKFDSV